MYIHHPSSSYADLGQSWWMMPAGWKKSHQSMDMVNPIADNQITSARTCCTSIHWEEISQLLSLFKYAISYPYLVNVNAQIWPSGNIWSEMPLCPHPFVYMTGEFKASKWMGQCTSLATKDVAGADTCCFFGNHWQIRSRHRNTTTKYHVQLPSNRPSAFGKTFELISSDKYQNLMLTGGKHLLLI